MKRTQNNSFDSQQVLSVIEQYSTALDLLDAYDHQTMKRVTRALRASEAAAEKRQQHRKRK